MSALQGCDVRRVNMLTILKGPDSWSGYMSGFSNPTAFHWKPGLATYRPVVLDKLFKFYELHLSNTSKNVDLTSGEFLKYLL